MVLITCVQSTLPLPMIESHSCYFASLVFFWIWGMKPSGIPDNIREGSTIIIHVGCCGLLGKLRGRQLWVPLDSLAVSSYQFAHKRVGDINLKTASLQILFCLKYFNSHLLTNFKVWSSMLDSNLNSILGVCFRNSFYNHPSPGKSTCIM